MSHSPSAAPGMMASMRNMLSHALALVQLRLELLTLEIAEERDRLARMLTVAVLAFFFLGFGVIALAVLLTVMLWDTQRLLPLAVLTAFFLGAGLVCALAVLRSWLRGSKLFAASLGEIAQDRVALLHPHERQSPNG